VAFLRNGLSLVTMFCMWKPVCANLLYKSEDNIRRYMGLNKMFNVERVGRGGDIVGCG
jgi:hypothetical protein